MLNDKLSEELLDFSKDVLKEFGGMIRAIVLFGSVASKRDTPQSDIDIFIIIDDFAVRYDSFVREWYRTKMAEILKKKKERERYHITTILLSVFWEMVHRGDPLAINVIRNGIPIVDSLGMFKSLKLMLYAGKIKPTLEAIYVSLSRVPHHFSLSNYYSIKALESLYWTFVDSAQAFLMLNGEVLPSPEQIPMYLKKYKDIYNISTIYIDWYKEIYNLIHSISRGEISSISGELLDKWRTRAERFTNKMRELILKKIDEELKSKK